MEVCTTECSIHSITIELTQMSMSRGCERRRETKLLPHTPTYILYAFSPPTCPHTCTADTFTSGSPSVSHSVSVALASVGASTCWKGEKCWQLSSPDLSPNNFVTLCCQLNSQIHLSQMSFNFHTSSPSYSLENLISEHTPGAPAVWQYPYLSDSAEVWNSKECLFVLSRCIVTRIMITISFTERYNVTSAGTYMKGVICRSICIIASVFSFLAIRSHWIRQSHNNPFFFTFFFASGLVQAGSLF